MSQSSDTDKICTVLIPLACLFLYIMLLRFPLFPGDASLTPRYSRVYGGKKILVAGPCFGINDQVKCKFANATVRGRVINSRTAACVAPLIWVRGRVPFTISTDDGATYTHTSTFIYGTFTFNLQILCIYEYRITL